MDYKIEEPRVFYLSNPEWPDFTKAMAYLEKSEAGNHALALVPKSNYDELVSHIEDIEAGWSSTMKKYIHAQFEIDRLRAALESAVLDGITEDEK